MEKKIKQDESIASAVEPKGMTANEVAKLLANRINPYHYIAHYMAKLYNTGLYNGRQEVINNPEKYGLLSIKGDTEPCSFHNYDLNGKCMRCGQTK